MRESPNFARLEGEVACTPWTDGPFGPRAAIGGTVRPERTILVIAHSVVTASRLADILPVLEADLRIQVVFTAAPSLFPQGTQAFLRRLGVAFITWDQAQHELFDLALAAGTGRLERVQAPVILMPHGVGYGKYPARWPGTGPAAQRLAHGTERQQLVYHGRVVPSAILLAHHDRLRMLEAACPEAVPAAVIAGDPCYDRLAASLPLRDSYRRAFGVGAGQKLVMVTSTWGSQSLLGQTKGLLPRLLDELPGDQFRIVTSLHPNIFAWHGDWQVRAWYADCMRSGMSLLPQAGEWRAAVAAADLVIGDYSSVTCYSAAARKPVLLGASPDGEVAPDSHVAMLGSIGSRLRPGVSLHQQVTSALEDHRPQRYAVASSMITSVPGQARRILREVVYRHLGMQVPTVEVSTDPVEVPC